MTVQELLKKSWSLRRNVVDIIMAGGVSYGALGMSLAWGLNGQVNYVLEGNLNYTGAVITWLKEDVSLIASASESEQRAQQGFPADYMTRRRSLRTRTAAASLRRWIIPSAKHATMVGRKPCGKCRRTKAY